MRSRKNILLTTLSIAFFSGTSIANDPFAEMDAEINSSHGNASAQWQQKRADDAFADMEREMREYRGFSREQQQLSRVPEKKPHVAEPVKAVPQPQVIIVREKIIEREVPVKTVVKAQPAVASKPAVNLPPPAAKKVKTSEQTVRTRNYMFELEACIKGGNDVICNLSVTSQKQDKKLALYAGTRLFDNLGNEYGPSSIQVANSQRRMNVYPYSISKQLITDVPTKVTITFSNVSNDALSVPKFSIKAKSQSDDFNVVYRNFALAAE